MFPPGAASLEKAKLAQEETIRRAMQDGVGFMSCAETGLGKTHVALGLASARGAQHMLVVCPAAVKLQWQKKAIEDGWVTAVWHASETEYAVGEVAGSYKHMDITNYESLERLVSESPPGYELLVLDESHKIKNAARGKLEKTPACVQAVYKLRDQHPAAFRLCLTATPIANCPIDAWNQLNWLWPGRFGAFWTYAQRYHEVTKMPHWEIGGPQAEFAEELRNRLEWCAHIVLKRDILVPAPMPKVVRGVGDEEYIRSLGTEPGKTLVFCFNRSRVEALSASFPEAIAFHGGQTPERRYRLIEKANAEGRMVITTMDAAGLGLDNLAKRSTAIYTQMAWKWVTISQAMGRNDRLSSELPPQNHFLVSNPVEERKIKVFCRKLLDIGKIIDVSGELSTLLPAKYEEADFEKDLEKFLAGREVGSVDWGLEEYI